jgi:hypothetical protein
MNVKVPLVDRLPILGLIILMLGRWRPTVILAKTDDGAIAVVSSGFVPIELWRMTVIVAILFGLIALWRPCKPVVTMLVGISISIAVFATCEYVVSAFQYGAATWNSALFGFGFCLLCLGVMKVRARDGC